MTTYEQLIRVSEQDLDQFGHANNQAYINWCQQAALAHSEQLGLGVDGFKALGQMIAIRSAEYDYLKAVTLADQLCISTAIVHSDGRLRVVRVFTIHCLATQTCVFKGCWQSVCVDILTGRASPMVSKLREVYVGFNNPSWKDAR